MAEGAALLVDEVFPEQPVRQWVLSVPYLDTCRACGGAVRIIACIEDPVIIEKILAHLDKQDAPTALSRLPETRAPPQAGLFDG